MELYSIIGREHWEKMKNGCPGHKYAIPPFYYAEKCTIVFHQEDLGNTPDFGVCSYEGCPFVHWSQRPVNVNKY